MCTNSKNRDMLLAQYMMLALPCQVSAFQWMHNVMVFFPPLKSICLCLCPVAYGDPTRLLLLAPHVSASSTTGEYVSTKDSVPFWSPNKSRDLLFPIAPYIARIWTPRDRSSPLSDAPCTRPLLLGLPVRVPAGPHLAHLRFHKPRPNLADSEYVSSAPMQSCRTPILLISPTTDSSMIISPLDQHNQPRSQTLLIIPLVRTNSRHSHPRTKQSHEHDTEIC